MTRNLFLLFLTLKINFLLVNIMSYLFLALAIISEVVATSFLKATEGFTILVPSVIVATAYVTAFYFLSLSLQGIPVGVAYAIWAGLGIVLIAFIGYFFLHQSLDAAAVAGMTLIIVGVAVIKLFSKTI